MSGRRAPTSAGHEQTNRGGGEISLRNTATARDDRSEDKSGRLFRPSRSRSKDIAGSILVGSNRCCWASRNWGILEGDQPSQGSRNTHNVPLDRGRRPNL